MKISLFNQRIVIEKNTVLVDSIGNHKNVWEEYFSCFAYVSSNKGNESSVVGTTETEEVLTFNVRYCSEIAALTSDEYRIRFGNNTYNITAIDWMNYQNRSVKIKAEKTERG